MAQRDSGGRTIDREPGSPTGEAHGLVDAGVNENFEETADCKGNEITASVGPDGKFTVTNGRNGFSKTYVARGAK